MAWSTHEIDGSKKRMTSLLRALTSRYITRRSAGTFLYAIVALCFVLWQATPLAYASEPPVAAPGAVAAPEAAVEPPPTHRALRDNVPREIPEPTEPGVFSGYPTAPRFSVVPQVDTLMFYPCSTCHNSLPHNPVPRKLETPHPAALKHGAGRFWCLQCHQEKDWDHLHTTAGGSVEFNDAYLVCGGCHFNRQKDWYFGAHGKRVGNWRGERVIYNCTYCHDPHDPTIKPRAPNKKPPIRAGLKPMPAYAREPAPGTRFTQLPGTTNRDR